VQSLFLSLYAILLALRRFMDYWTVTVILGFWSFYFSNPPQEGGLQMSHEENFMITRKLQFS